MKKLIAAFVLLASIAALAWAQTSPGVVRGQVWTAAQWNAYFATKLDYPAKIPLVLNNSGTTPPTPATGTMLQITQAAATPNLVEMYGWGTGGTGANPSFRFYRSYGTPSAPAVPGAGVNLVDFGAGSYDGAAYQSRKGTIGILTYDTWTTISTPTRIIFGTTPNNSTTLRTVAQMGEDGGFSALSRIAAGTIDPLIGVGSGVYYGGTSAAGGSAAGMNASPTWASASLTNGGNAFAAFPNITGTATVPLVTGYLALGGTQAGASTISAWSGFDAFALPTGGTLSFAAGFRGRYAAASNRYNLYMDGTAQNYLAGALSLGSSALTISAGGVGLKVITAPGVAPGAAGAGIYAVCGTAGGTAKLIVYAGTSSTPSTIVDNVGGGVAGC